MLLTTFLFTYRAATGGEPSEVSREREQSAFNWFLKSVVRRHSLDGTAETSALLCQTLCQELGTSSRMKQHVLSTMVHVLTPCSTPGLFLQLKQVKSHLVLSILNALLTEGINEY